jgi:hypothetical protein
VNETAVEVKVMIMAIMMMNQRCVLNLQKREEAH